MKPEQSPPGPQLLRIDPFNPQELLGLIPYLIGFRPAESFVLLMFSGSQLVLTARIDLPAPDSATALADYHRELAETYGVTGVLGVVFSDRFVPATELLDRWHAAWSRSEPPESGGGCVILGAWYADGRRCWSRAPGSPAARSGGIPYDPLSSEAAATAVMAGLPTYGSREELAALVAGPPASDRAELAALTARTVRDLDPVPAPARRALIRELVAAAAGAGADAGDETCARLAVLAGDIGARDVAWSMITRETADDHVDLWTRVVRRTVERFALGPLALAGVAAWIAGQGALMNCCIERGEAIDDSYSMIGLLAEISSRGIPPTVWQELGPALRKGVRPLS